MKKEIFNYNTAFQRNLGLLTIEEQNKIKNFKIGIVGMGGVGGNHLINLVRMGFTKFNISDLDKFEMKNTNRQYGSNINTYNKEKVLIMEKYAKEINPELKINVFNKGIAENNIENFLEDIDIFIDAIDFYEQKIRRKLFNRALQKNIPVITSGPIGMGCAYLVFLPGGMNYDEFFDVNDDTTEEDMSIKFLLGLTPKLLQAKYIHRELVKYREHKVPSLASGVNLATGVLGIEVIKTLLKNGPIKAVPYTHQFDAYLYKHESFKLHFGNKNPIQKIKFIILKKILL